MKKDKISMLILIVEIVAITALHATKNGEKSVPEASVKKSPSNYFTTTLQPSSSAYLILPGYPY